MLEQQVAAGALTAVYALVVAEDVLDLVQPFRVGNVVDILPAVAAHNLHLQSGRDSLTFIAIFVVLKLGCRLRLVVKLPPLRLPG